MKSILSSCPHFLAKTILFCLSSQLVSRIKTSLGTLSPQGCYTKLTFLLRIKRVGLSEVQAITKNCWFSVTRATENGQLFLRTLLQVPFRQRHPNERTPSTLIDLFLLMISIASLLVALQLIASGDSSWFEYSLPKLDPFDSIIVGLVLSAIGVLLALPFHRTWVKVLTAFVVTGGVASIIGFARGLPSFFELLGVLTPGYVASLPIAYGIQRIEFDKTIQTGERYERFERAFVAPLDANRVR